MFAAPGGRAWRSDEPGEHRGGAESGAEDDHGEGAQTERPSESDERAAIAPAAKRATPRMDDAVPAYSG